MRRGAAGGALLISGSRVGMSVRGIHADGHDVGVVILLVANERLRNPFSGGRMREKKDPVSNS